ncbi:hypothetical protein J7T55_004501 [Diaporthe amygdali]|uniref:uncharacterized protein n=1 Tax=Phomopsis amygdali TaxID=1214568 RepID=UPI0022FE9FFC|nr:uncharacterized protein J7T55_004501 [Diaporthe amygdali]KAJ0114760.1 hypothetical protein J7T55_004501 [Diaporthe amygdali]
MSTAQSLAIFGACTTEGMFEVAALSAVGNGWAGAGLGRPAAQTSSWVRCRRRQHQQSHQQHQQHQQQQTAAAAAAVATAAAAATATSAPPPPPSSFSFSSPPPPRLAEDGHDDEMMMTGPSKVSSRRFSGLDGDDEPSTLGLIPLGETEQDQLLF